MNYRIAPRWPARNTAGRLGVRRGSGFAGIEPTNPGCRLVKCPTIVVPLTSAARRNDRRQVEWTSREESSRLLCGLWIDGRGVPTPFPRAVYPRPSPTQIKAR